MKNDEAIKVLKRMLTPELEADEYHAIQSAIKSLEALQKGKDNKMSRLEILKKEREQISQMRCLSFDLMEKCKEWYDHEIECIENREEEECTNA